ncbi:MAG: type VI secretion system baseplate subunit TssE [Candidatus Tectomicrobia bacterium]|nr:type VI secretion system baseplate subunit TssE [Candidatus Tectomicrobia bacterium]
MRKQATRTQAGARALLFDRLVDLDPHTPAEPLPLRVLTTQKLRQSVRREVERLLNTRLPIPAHDVIDWERTVLDYGVPDFTALSPHSSTDQDALASGIRDAIDAFEPRLQQVRVNVERFADDQKALVARIDADLVVEGVSEPVSFPVLIRSGSGEAEVE